MGKLNIASLNMLIRKVYLLAGVIIAANMFIVNEVRASEESDYKNKVSISAALDTASEFILKLENTINFAGGLVVSGFNNYFKWWNYNPGRYGEFGCYGWRTKRCLKNYLQFEVNLNLCRGSCWMVPGVYFFIRYPCKKYFYLPYLIAKLVGGKYVKKNSTSIIKPYFFIISFFIVFLVQGFWSAPLTVYLSKFNISVSLDSIIWGVVGKFLSLVVKEESEEEDDNLGASSTHINTK